MSESQMWAVFRPLIAHLDPERIENAVKIGTPDVNYVEGWIELKEILAWPNREFSIVQVRHYKPHQRVWHTRRCRAGGRCFVLLRVRDTNEWLLFRGEVAATFLGRVPRSELLRNNIGYFQGLPDRDQFCALIGAPRK